MIGAMLPNDASMIFFDTDPRLIHATQPDDGQIGRSGCCQKNAFGKKVTHDTSIIVTR